MGQGPNLALNTRSWDDSGALYSKGLQLVNQIFTKIFYVLLLNENDRFGVLISSYAKSLRGNLRCVIWLITTLLIWIGSSKGLLRLWSSSSTA